MSDDTPTPDDVLKRLLSEAKAEIATLRQERNAAVELVDVMKSERRFARAEIDRLYIAGEYADAEKKISGLEAENARLRQELDAAIRDRP